MNDTQKKNIRCLGIIPARGGSKSIPKKNIAQLGGKPLIYYTIVSAQNSKLLDAFLVSTDDENIAGIARSFGADVPFLRPSKFSTDKATDLGFLKHALLWVKKHRGWTPEIVLNLRPTGPFRSGSDIDRVIQTMLETGCDSVRTVTSPEPHNPFKMWYVDIETKKMKPLIPTKYFGKYGTDIPRQLLPQNVYWQDGLVDATRTKFILKQNKIYGPDIRAVIVPKSKSVDIDGPEDLEYAEHLMGK